MYLAYIFELYTRSMVFHVDITCQWCVMLRNHGRVRGLIHRIQCMAWFALGSKHGLRGDGEW